MRATVHDQAGDLVMEGEHRYLLLAKATSLIPVAT